MSLDFLLQMCLPAAFMAAVGILLTLFLVRYFRPAPSAACAAPVPIPVRQVLVCVGCWFALSRLLIFLAVYIGSGFDLAFSADPQSTWARWDANHYLGLAENGYVNEGDARLHIVFYPLYPLAVWLVRPIAMGNVLASAYLVSNVCALGCGWAMFRLVEMECDGAAARRAVGYLMMCPVSLFASLPYSESLFLLLVVCSALMARRGKLPVAILLGALASATRVLGLLCAVPVFYEALRRAREDAAGRGAPLWRGIATGVLCTSLIAAGFGAYLLLNRAVTGDWFRFLVYQREHWSQEFGSLGNSVRYTLENLISPSSLNARLGIWLPQIASMALVLALMMVAARRAHPADCAYAVLYYYIALSPTWLLSGARYLGAMYAVYPMLALATRRRWQRAAVTVLFAAGTAYCAYQYAVAGALF